MDTNFDKCLVFVLKEEGGNDDDPHDHGGRTSRGITQREWDEYRTVHQGTLDPRRDLPADVWKAEDEDIKSIYHDRYWLPHCSNLADGLDLVFFDFSVNAGVGQAIKTLQRTMGVPADGIWGPQTENAYRQGTLTDIINHYSDLRETFYHGLAQYPRYGKDWSGRTERCRHASLLMVGATPPSPKANPVDVKPAVPVHGPAAGTVVVAAGTAAAAHYHSPLIFLGVLFAAVAVGLGVHYLTNRKVN